MDPNSVKNRIRNHACGNNKILDLIKLDICSVQKVVGYWTWLFNKMVSLHFAHRFIRLETFEILMPFLSL